MSEISARAALANIMNGVANSEDYVRYMHQLFRERGAAFVRIGITGTGKALSH